MRYTNRPIFIPLLQNKIPMKIGQTDYQEIGYTNPLVEHIKPTYMPTPNDHPPGPLKEAMLFHDLICDYERYLRNDQVEVANESLRTLRRAISRHLGEEEAVEVFTRQGRKVMIDTTVDGVTLKAILARAQTSFDQLGEFAKGGIIKEPTSRKDVDNTTPERTDEPPVE